MSPGHLTLDEHFPARLWWSVGSSWLGSLQAGYQIAVLNTALDHAIDSGTLRNIRASAVLIGAVLGALCARTVSGVWGPRSAQTANAALYLTGSCLAAAAWWSNPCFIIGRVLAGIGAGANSVHVQQYVTEILPHELRRGTLSYQHPLLLSMGVMLAMLMGLPYQFGVDNVKVVGLELLWWQVMVGAAAVPAAVQLLCLLSCPESPAWLEGSDKDKADEACIALWGSHAILYEAPCTPARAPRLSYASASTHASADPPAPVLSPGLGHGLVGLGSSFDKLEQLALAEGGWHCEDPLTAALLGEEADAPTLEPWRRTARRYEYRWVMMLALGLPLLMQASGGSSVLLFSSQIFPELAGPHVVPPIWGCIALGLSHLTASCASGKLAEVAGRRLVLISSFVGQAACLFTSAVILCFPGLPSARPPEGTEGSGPARSTSAMDMTNCVLLMAYTAFFALGSGPALWQYIDEILPSHIKAPVSAMALTLSWTCALLVSISVLPAIHGPVAIRGMYLVYGLFAVLGVVLVCSCMVESKGRTAAELEELLLLHPKPKLRNLFPVPSPSSGAHGVAHSLGHGPGHGHDSELSPDQQQQLQRGGKAWRGPGTGELAAAAAKLAAQTWTKLTNQKVQQQYSEPQSLAQSF